MLISIIIPSFKAESELQSNKQEILNSLKDYTRFPYEIILTCQIGKSAAINRNYGLNQAKGDIIIQCDDDITGFFPGWLDLLIEPLLKDPNIIMSSARLMKPDRVTFNFMVGLNLGTHIEKDGIIEVPAKRLPSACIATRKDELRFNELYIGSGVEDSQFALDLSRKYPNGRFVVVDKCRVVHRNEQKQQCGSFNDTNRATFYRINGFHV